MKKLYTESYTLSDDLINELRSILSEEYLANEMYQFAIIAMIGNKNHQLEELSEENGKDEVDDHFKNLYLWMQSKDISVVVSHKEMEKLAQSTQFEFTENMSTSEIIDKLILSEEEAISHYEDVLERDDVKFDLHVMLCDFLKDERQHLKDLIDIKNEMIDNPKRGEPDSEVSTQDVDDDENDSEVELDDGEEDDNHVEVQVTEE